MTSVFIKYNPYKVETTISIDGELIDQNSYLSQFYNDRLQVWVDKLVDKLIEELNDDSFQLVFQGTRFDFEDVAEVCDYYNKNRGTDIQLKYIPAERNNDKISELKGLFEHMQRGPFADLRSDGIRKNFENALSSDFEIAVIATMSSGKSTLINALLGQELMPSKHAACTATIASIRNVDESEEFIARCLDDNGREIEPWRKITLDDMKQYNDNEEVSTIQIEGNIPYISSRKMNLVLVDTPGPNNSRNSSHRDQTNRVIKNETKPMVLYILNATALAIDDDAQLLSTVAEQMKSGGKQSKDRFLFAVNKMDEFDSVNDGTVWDTIAMVREYLEEKGIENPNIFPVTAELAKLIRMNHNGFALSKKQKSTLNEHELLIEEEELHLSSYAPLSKWSKERLERELQKARNKENTYEEALIHTGIPAVEEAINEYLEKYAITSKVTAAVNSFKDVVESKRLEQTLKNDLVVDEQRRMEINKQMKTVKEEIDKGQMARQFKDRINRKQYNHQDIIARIEGKIETKIDDMTANFIERGRIEESEAKRIITRLEQEIQSLQSDIKTDLELIIIMTLKNDAKELLEEYQNYVKDLLEVSGNALNSEDFSIFTSEIPNAQSIVQEIAYKEDVADGETWVSTSSWWNPFSWGDGYYRTDYTTKTFVNVNDIAEKVIFPTKLQLFENINLAQDYLINEELRLKEYFNNEINRLEKLLNEKVEEIERLSSDSEYLREKLQRDRHNYEWLQDFIIRLDNAIEI